MGIGPLEVNSLYVSKGPDLAYQLEGGSSNTHLLEKEFVEKCEGKIEEEVKHEC